MRSKASGQAGTILGAGQTLTGIWCAVRWDDQTTGIFDIDALELEAIADAP